jgi:hypothetical protein
MLFINAASEITATVLTGAVNHLLQSPGSQCKLEKEIRKFHRSSNLTLQALKQLPYLNGPERGSQDVYSKVSRMHISSTTFYEANEC